MEPVTIPRDVQYGKAMICIFDIGDRSLPAEFETASATLFDELSCTSAHERNASHTGDKDSPSGQLSGSNSSHFIFATLERIWGCSGKKKQFH